MRLSSRERQIIREQALAIFGKGTSVYLFGSRVDDNKRGGDIDLYIEMTDKTDLTAKEIQFDIQLQVLLGEQKIDIVVAMDPHSPIEQVARSEGIKL